MSSDGSLERWTTHSRLASATTSASCAPSPVPIRAPICGVATTSTCAGPTNEPDRTPATPLGPIAAHVRSVVLLTSQAALATPGSDSRSGAGQLQSIRAGVEAGL
jgi:hypothetical protein